MAEKLKLTPGEQDPTVKMKLANGAIIDGKLMTLKSVRVGRFTVNNVSCIMLQEGLSDPPTILGTSFLSHFVVKLSQSAGELHLRDVGDGSKGAGAKSDAAEPLARSSPFARRRSARVLGRRFTGYRGRRIIRNGTAASGRGRPQVAGDPVGFNSV